MKKSTLFALALLSPFAFAVACSDSSSGTGVVDSGLPDTSVADTGTATDTSTSADTSVASDTGSTVTDSGSTVADSGAGDGGACSSIPFPSDIANPVPTTGVGTISEAATQPATGYYTAISVAKPAGAPGANYRGMLSFVNSSIFIAEQWDNGPIVNRKVSQTIANGSFNITPICGTFPGSQSWKFGYIVPDGGKKRVHILLPGLDPAQNYEFVFEKTI